MINAVERSPSSHWPPMFTPRADITDSCSGLDDPEACSAPSDSDASQGIDPSLMERQAAHRYIGIGMVAGLILIIFLVWLYRGRWPRKMLQQYCCCSSRSKQPPKNIDDETPSTLIRSPDRDKSTMGGSETVKEVSAGMIVFTKVPNALRGKEQFPMEWEMDHVDRLETQTPHATTAWNDGRQS